MCKQPGLATKSAARCGRPLRAIISNAMACSLPSFVVLVLELQAKGGNLTAPVKTEVSESKASKKDGKESKQSAQDLKAFCRCLAYLTQLIVFKNIPDGG